MIVILAKEDCRCDLVTFYENVARKAGLKFTDDSVFDCRKLLITKAVQSEIRAYYHEQGSNETDTAVLLAQYGPKALMEPNDTAPYKAEIQEGFINDYPTSEV